MTQPSWSDEARPWAPPREGAAVEVRDISRRTRSLPLARTAMASRCLLLWIDTVAQSERVPSNAEAVTQFYLILSRGQRTKRLVSGSSIT